MIVYKTTNLVTGKVYVGLDKKNNPEYLGSGLLLRRAIRKYGKENFKKETLETCETVEELQERERFWIKEFSSQNRKIGYNVADGGTGGDTFTNNLNKEEIREKFKRSHTEETKKKISKNNWGSTHKGESHFKYGTSWTEEQRKKMNVFYETKGGPMKGKKHTDEAKSANREKHLGKKASGETKQKMRLSKLGKVQRLMTCPNCGKTGGGNTMYRWHFDNCKHKVK